MILYSNPERFTNSINMEGFKGTCLVYDVWFWNFIDLKYIECHVYSETNPEKSSQVARFISKKLKNK